MSRPSRSRLALPATLALALACMSPASADILLVERAQAKPESALPARGASAAQVEARFGAPTQKLQPRGGQKRQWPTINRWVYPEFTVYFERDRVIDAVLNQAAPGEAGPKPAVR